MTTIRDRQLNNQLMSQRLVTLVMMSFCFSQDIDKNSEEPIPVFLVGNKCDLKLKRMVKLEQGVKVIHLNVFCTQKKLLQDNNQATPPGT